MRLALLPSVCLMLAPLLCRSSGTTTTPLPSPTLPPPTDKLEETVIMSLLKIVDEKFETLSSRMGQMERAVTGLQFFTMRTLRGLTNKVQNTAALTQVMHGKLGDSVLDSRTLKTTVSRISHDIGSIKETNSKKFEKLERSIAFMNRNIAEKTSDIMSGVESIQLRREEEGVKHEDDLVDEGSEPQEFIERRETVLNCSIDLRALQEQIDNKFNQLRNQSHFQFEKLRNQSEVHFNKLKFTTFQEFERLSKETESYYQKQTHISDGQFSALRNHTQAQYDSLKRQSLSQYTRLANITFPKAAAREYRTQPTEDVIDNERLFVALSNMTSHVVQSISFIRHTESMLERIIENTDNVAFEQEKLRKDVTDAVSKSISAGLDSAITEGGTNLAQEGGGQQTTGCTLPEEVLKDIATFSKNGSQLFEILTDLAQISQVSLSSSIVELQDEVLRMEETRVKQEKQTNLLPTYAAGDYNLALQKILNTSKNALRMAEAIAPNTGWIPYIYHHIQHVEGQLNRSMAVTTRFFSELRDLKGQWGRHDANAQTQGASFNIPNESDRRNSSSSGSSSSKKNDEALEFILDTNVKLQRIMPALTRFIAEPEPLITLMDGRKSNEGRVEIFQHGQWGTVCDKKFGHAEAAAICRHLGFVGGIFAGRGQFGPGSGVTWAFNHTCLQDLRCAVVGEMTEDKSCSHRADVGIMCDHMLRLVSVEGNNDVDTGHIEIYQNSKWRPVCAHGFGRNEAQVSCRQMGYHTGWMRDARGRSRDNSPVWMTNVQCRGTETRLDACRHNNFGQRPCPGNLPATVTCE